MSTTPTPTPAAPAPAPITSPSYLPTAIHFLAWIVVAVLGLIAWHSYDSEREARIKAEASEAAQQKIIATATDQIRALQVAQDARDKQTAAEISSIKATAAAAATPAQIAAYLASTINRAGAPVPITISTPAPTAADPHPAAIATLPAADLGFLRDQVAKCSADAVALPAAQADLSTCQQQKQLAGQQLSAVENERDAWKKAAKGTFWSRFKTGAKYVGITAGVTAAAICGSGHCK